MRTIKAYPEGSAAIDTCLPDHEEWHEAFTKYQPEISSKPGLWALVIGEVLETSDPGEMEISEEDIREGMTDEMAKMWLPDDEPFMLCIWDALIWGHSRGWWTLEYPLSSPHISWKQAETKPYLGYYHTILESINDKCFVDEDPDLKHAVRLLETEMVLKERRSPRKPGEELFRLDRTRWEEKP